MHQGVGFMAIFVVQLPKVAHEVDQEAWSAENMVSKQKSKV